MHSYEGYRGLLRGGILYARIRASRPPPTAPHWVNASTAQQIYDQEECEARPECSRFYRGRSALYFGHVELCEALRRHVPAARMSNSACYQSIGDSATRAM